MLTTFPIRSISKKNNNKQDFDMKRIQFLSFLPSTFTLLLISTLLVGITDGGGLKDTNLSKLSLTTATSPAQLKRRIKEPEERIKMDASYSNMNKISSTIVVQGPVGPSDGSASARDFKSDERNNGVGDCLVIKLKEPIVGKMLKCNGTSNLTITLGHIEHKLAVLIKSIEISLSTIHILNLDDFHKFPNLENISVTESSVSSIIGHSPVQILSLNLSSNHLKSLDNSIFQTSSSSLSPLDYNYNYSEDNRLEIGEGEALPRLQVIDLSHNKITDLPKAIFYLESLKTLRLTGNQFKCEFVWDKLWEWYVRSDPSILVDADDTFCGVVDDVRVFHYTILGVLKAHKDLEETCGSVDKSLCPDCSLYALQRDGYPISHKSSHGIVSISLKLDCSNMNLTQLPPVPLQTWQLNISNNQIKDLSPLKDPMYTNLLILDGDNNQINLNTLTHTAFMDKYNYLSLQNNHFSTIPTEILSSFKSMRGQGVTFFGGNFIDCDCDSVKEVKPLLIENSKKIKDMKDIYCKEMTNGDGTSYMRVKDLQYPDVCHMESESSSHEAYLYLIIVMEVALIVLIIGKVWHDRRTFRQTGILPWCSSKMPRLPCDAMLESVKEPPNSNNRHVTGSAASSSTNVNAHSISHIKLKDVRSSSSAHSEKSSSQQSQFSSFPNSSSRTSPV